MVFDTLPWPPELKFLVNYMFCAPHAFHLSDRAGDLDRMIR